MICLLAPVPVVLLHVHTFAQFSVVDELPHVDYLDRVQRGHLLRPGELIQPRFLHEWACRGLDIPWTDEELIPECSAARDYEPEDFPAYGLNYHWDHPPLYYYLTGLATRPLEGIPGFDFVDAARTTGAIWLGAGLAVFWVLAWREGIPLGARIAVTSLLGLTPTILHLSSIVNNDATALVAGGLVLLTVLAWERNRRLLWILAPVAAMAVALKATNVVAVIGGAIYLLIRGVSGASATRPALRRGPYLVASSLLAAGAGASLLVWAVVRPDPVAGFTDPFLETIAADELSLAQVGSQLGALLTPIRQLWAAPFLRTLPATIVSQVFHWGLIAGCAVAAVLPTTNRKVRALAIGGIGGLVAGAALLTVASYLARGLLFPLWSRYGLSLMPMLGLCMAATMVRRSMLVAGAILAIGTIAVVGQALAWP